ncbi:hypothetical protein EROM_071510 [Encephalitozoon romaleae SJ-2008]|uniref:Uncharacterized protein n=1 Tax=Encephalitozoon romaleae (strain SJ-2008) TaxID=1178016 RepID=I7ASJ1_ENCRO|nr:hypothetical protein EROM_071510 [Encephalitozoon romaleae SJ-2008]AFN83402.1 hypothetical protein EROM_071510 [Encephalitozoon romaleae SJ-2008]
MLGTKLSLIVFFISRYATAQIMKLQANEGNPTREMPCNCRIDDQRCRDSCSKVYSLGNRNSKALGTADARKPSVVTIKKILQQEERPFIRFVEKNIERNNNNQVLGNDDTTTRRPTTKVFDGDGNTIFYNGSSYKICDLYGQANRTRGTKEYLSVNDDMRILYEYVMNNPKVERICAKNAIEYPTPFDPIDNVSLPLIPSSRTDTDHPEPIILERNNMIPIFIKESFESAPEKGLSVIVKDSGSSVSIITLKTTSITTTTTTKIGKQEYNEPVKKTETQTILTTRTVTRQRGSTRKGFNGVVKTVLKTVFVGSSDNNRNKTTFEDQEPDAMPSSETGNGPKKPPLDGMTNTLTDIPIIEKIRSLLNLPAQTNTRNASSVPSEAILKSRTASPQIITTTVERIRTTSARQSSSGFSSIKGSNNSYYDDYTRELIRSIFDMLKGSTTTSESRRVLPNSSTIVKETTTTVTKTTTRARDYTPTVSIVPSVEIKSPYFLTASSVKSKERLESSIYESYEKKLDNIYQKIMANEEQYKNLIGILLSIRKKEKDEDNTLSSLKKMYELYRDGTIYEKSVASHLMSERRSKSKVMPYSVESNLNGGWKDRTHDGISGSKNNLRTQSRENAMEEVSSLAYKEDEPWKGLEGKNINNGESDAPISLVLGDFEPSNEKQPKYHSFPSVVSFFREPDLKKRLRKERAFKDLQYPTITGFLNAKDNRDEIYSRMMDVEKDTGCKTITDTIRTTVIRDFNSSVHLSAVSSIVEERMKGLERKLNEFSDRVVQIGNRLLMLKNTQEQKSLTKEDISTSEIISPTISRSSIYNGRNISTKTMVSSIETFSSTTSVGISIAQKSSSSLDPEEKASISHYGPSTLSVSTQTTSLGGKGKEQSIDGIVEKIKEKKISDESLLISDDAVIDDIVEKLAPLVNSIEISSLGTATRTQKEMSPQSVV